MRNTVDYEWDYETCEGNEVLEHNFQEKLSSFQPHSITDTLVLVRNTGNEGEGLVDRMWAYVRDGKLPEYFSDELDIVTGYKVPKAYHIELAKYLKS